MEHLLISDMPEEEKSTTRLTGESIAILAAGTGTTERTLATITYFALADRRIETRMRQELKDIMMDFPNAVPRSMQLEKLPFLTACIKEGLR